MERRNAFIRLHISPHLHIKHRITTDDGIGGVRRKEDREACPRVLRMFINQKAVARQRGHRLLINHRSGGQREGEDALDFAL